jgi:hypothetical protein
MKDDDPQKFTSPLAIDSKIFTTHLPILVTCKTKGTVGAVCALLRNWQLGACAADFSLLNLPKGKSLGRSKPATDS